jgi:hypothetical protein
VAKDARITLVPSSSRFEPDDDRWERQVAELRDALRAEVGPVTRKPVATDGGKGATEVIEAILGAGAVKYAVEAFKYWLGRDRTRSLTVELPDGRTFTAGGDAIDTETMHILAKGLSGLFEEDGERQIPGTADRQQHLPAGPGEPEGPVRPDQ